MKSHSLKPGASFSPFSTNASGLLVCLIALLVPLFPDEKIIRLKLEVFEILIFLSVLFLGLRVGLERKQAEHSQRAKFVLWALWVWVGVMGGLYLFSNEKVLALAEWRRVILGLGCFSVFYFGAVTESWIKRFLVSWNLIAGLVSVYGILQISGGFGPIAVPPTHRAFSTFGNPIFFAAYLIVSIFISLACVRLNKKSNVRNLIYLSLFLQIIALYLTKTRAAWIALVFSFVAYFILKTGMKKIPAWVFGVFFLGLLVFGILTQDTWKRDQGHLMIWRDTLHMWQDHKVTGIGLGAFHTQFPDFARDDLKAKWPKGKFIVNYAHNEYIQMLAESGFLGFGSFLILLIMFFNFLWPKFRVSEKSKVALANDWLVLGVVALLIQNFFSVDMRFSITFGFLFLLMGLVLVNYEEKRVVSDLSFGSFVPSKAHGIIFSSIWVLFLFVFIGPRMMKPYLAQKEFSKQVNFFDSRLLDPNKTISDLEELHREHPEEISILEKLAFSYSKEIRSKDGKINRGMVEKAIKAYQKLLVIHPNNSSANNNLANIYYTSGQVDNALAQWEKAAAANPELIDVHLNLGKIYYTRGELKKSAKHFESVLQKNPQNAEAQVYLKRMVE